MIELRIKNYNRAQIEMLSFCIYSAQEFLATHNCDMYECHECPYKPVCRDLRLAGDYVDKILAE